MAYGNGSAFSAPGLCDLRKRSKNVTKRAAVNRRNVRLTGAWITWQETRHLSDYSSLFQIAWAPDFFARIFIGYLVYDMVVMIWYYKELYDPTAILHHFIFLMAATYVVAHSIMAYAFSWLAFTEVSTPFLNIRYAWNVASSNTLLLPDRPCAQCVLPIIAVMFWQGHGAWSAAS